MIKYKVEYILLPLFFLLFGCIPHQRTSLDNISTIPAGNISFKVDGEKYIFESKAFKRTLTINQFTFEGRSQVTKGNENLLELRLRVRLDSSKMSVTLNNCAFDKRIFTNLRLSVGKTRLRPPLAFYVDDFFKYSAITNTECNVINFKANLMENPQDQTVSGTFEGIACGIDGKEKYIKDGIIHKVKIKKHFED